ARVAGSIWAMSLGGSCAVDLALRGFLGGDDSGGDGSRGPSDEDDSDAEDFDDEDFDDMVHDSRPSHGAVARPCNRGTAPLGGPQDGGGEWDQPRRRAGSSDGGWAPRGTSLATRWRRIM